MATNRQILKAIIETLILCGRQNVPLRGHRDNLTDIERDPEDAIGHGNFWALLQFRIGSGDQVWPSILIQQQETLLTHLLMYKTNYLQ